MKILSVYLHFSLYNNAYEFQRKGKTKISYLLQTTNYKIMLF